MLETYSKTGLGKTLQQMNVHKQLKYALSPPYYSDTGFVPWHYSLGNPDVMQFFGRNVAIS